MMINSLNGNILSGSIQKIVVATFNIPNGVTRN